MTKVQMIMLCNAQPGKDAQYREWYYNRHLPDVVALPGVSGGQCFEAVGKARHRYMAVYDLETEDVQPVIDEMMARLGTDAMPQEDVFDHSDILFASYASATLKVSK